MIDGSSRSARPELRGRALISGLAALLLGLAACADRAEQPAAPAPTTAVGPGRILYLTYCQSCHGLAGRGDGPVAAWLRQPPPDLTRLWERYGTPLDRERLAEYIDGRWLVDVHGTREMPLWGSEFFVDAPPMAPSLEGDKRHLLRVLAEYLETLQTERPL